MSSIQKVARSTLYPSQLVYLTPPKGVKVQARKAKVLAREKGRIDVRLFAPAVEMSFDTRTGKALDCPEPELEGLRLEAYIVKEGSAISRMPGMPAKVVTPAMRALASKADEMDERLESAKKAVPSQDTPGWCLAMTAVRAARRNLAIAERMSHMQFWADNPAWVEYWNIDTSEYRPL